MTNKNATKADSSSALNTQKDNNKKTIKIPTKLELCLQELLIRGDAGLAELEALNSYGDTCLHSTISTLANSKGLIFKRVPEKHTHQRGGVTRFTRYSLFNGEEKVKAKMLLNHYRTMRYSKVAA